MLAAALTTPPSRVERSPKILNGMRKYKSPARKPGLYNKSAKAGL